MNSSRFHIPVASSIAWKIRLLALLFVLVPGVMPAQSSIGEMRRQATREELERAAKAAESASLQQPDEKVRAKLRADAATIRERLQNGDFIPGDRILLLVAGDSALSDTFTVRGDRMLPLPNIPAISLHGVLDSELEPYLTKELQKYIKSVTLEATPLVRLSLLGFPQANFYTVPVDQAITDVIAAAGGWGSLNSVAPDKAVVRRNGKVFLDAKATAAAVREAKTVGDMALRDGDELYLPDKANSGFNWQGAIGAASAVATLIWALRYAAR
jgi:protein involved in polysaccharide export with SLBB domain